VAESEAARIHAGASINAREELLGVKNEVIGEIMKAAKKALAESPDRVSIALKLTREAIEAAGVAKVRVCASKEDVAELEKLIKADKSLSGKVEEVTEYKCSGGALVEDVEGTISIDNTFETRLDMLMSRVLPEINRELFGE
jgi:V/A-type H+-transporting ATPase subunit E